MPLDASLVGRALPEQRIKITPRMALAYAAAIGDDSRICLDDEATDFIAHPAFCVSLEWQIVIAGRANGMGLTPAESVRGIHAGQNTVFHKPLTPGMTARVAGKIVDIRATKAGALSRTRLTTSDAETGTVHATTLTSSIFRDVAVAGKAPHAGDLEDVTESQWLSFEPASDTINLDRWFAHRYTECANIWNPIHTERRAAQAAGLPDIIVHGTALWALAGRTLISRYGNSDPRSLAALAGRFSAMVLPDTAITVLHERNDAIIHFTVLNHEGREAISRGVAMIA